jgi:hypothetical protein
MLTPRLRGVRHATDTRRRALRARRLAHGGVGRRDSNATPSGNRGRGLDVDPCWTRNPRNQPPADCQPNESFATHARFPQAPGGGRHPSGNARRRRKAGSLATRIGRRAESVRVGWLWKFSAA